MPRFSALIAAALLAAGCAQPPAREAPAEAKIESPALPPLPASYMSNPGCPGCLAVTLTLRPDGSYLARERIGTSEFYDFGRWRYAEGKLELDGGRDKRQYALHALKRSPAIERLTGPFRMVGLYDGASFKECLTGLAWKLTDTRAAETLKQQYLKRSDKPALVALDAQFDGSPEMLRVLRPAALLNATSCPG